MSDTVRWKEYITTSHFHNCKHCPKYFRDMDGEDWCVLGDTSRRVNKDGKEIPEWCILTDIPDPNVRVNHG